MGKSSAAENVVDLEAFRQRKLMRAERAAETTSAMPRAAAVFVPVWFCWVPVWAPAMP